MTRERILVGIAFNTFLSLPRYSSENLSEETIEETAQEVFNAVKASGYSVTTLPLRESLVGFLRRIRELKIDVLVNLCEGFCGQPQFEANVAAALELTGIAFTGNTSRTLGLCQDKFKAKAVLQSFGLPTPTSKLVASAEQPIDLNFPVIVKPNFEDASLGIYPDSVAIDAEGLKRRIAKIIDTYNQSVLIEEYIEGREFNVAILDNDQPEALPVSEIDFSTMPETLPHICSYEAKWFEDHFLFKSTPPVCPAKIDSGLKSRLQQTALSAYQALGGRDYARVDFRMDKEGRLFILEVNPNPDISQNAGYSRALLAAGIDYNVFWHNLIEKALRRSNNHDSANGNKR